MLIDLDEIERRIPSPATECAYCHRLATLVCPVCGTMVCEDHRILAARDAIGTECEGVAMVPAHHDTATMDRVALVAEVRRLRAPRRAGAARELQRTRAHAARAVGRRQPRGAAVRAVRALPCVRRRPHRHRSAAVGRGLPVVARRAHDGAVPDGLRVRRPALRAARRRHAGRRAARRGRARGDDVMRLADIRRRITAALRSIADRVEPPAPPPVGTPVRVGDLRVGDVFRTTTHRPGEWPRVVRLESWTEAKEHGGRTWVTVFTERGSVATLDDRTVYRRAP